MSFLFSRPKMPSPPPMPSAPEPKKITAEASAEAKKKLRRGLKNRRTIFTSPLGLATEAPVERKTLLGV